VNTFGRNYRIEIYTPAGQWKWGQWVNGREGYGTVSDRLERAALYTGVCEPAGSIVRVFRYVPYSAPPVVEMFALRLPGGGTDFGPIPLLPSERCECSVTA
jgi:hypothetical protein